MTRDTGEKRKRDHSDQTDEDLDEREKRRRLADDPGKLKLVFF